MTQRARLLKLIDDDVNMANDDGVTPLIAGICCTEGCAHADNHDYDTLYAARQRGHIEICQDSY